MFPLFNINEINDRKIICFGAGTDADAFINNWDISFMRYQLLAFTDLNPAFYGKKRFGPKGSYYEGGIPILSFSDVVQKIRQEPDILIVITSNQVQEITEKIRSENITNDIIEQKEFYSLANRELTQKALIPMGERLHADFAGVYQRRMWGRERGDYIAFRFIRFLLDYQYHNKEFVYLLSPPKTGNHTVYEAMNKCGINNANTHSLCFGQLFEDENFFRLFKNNIPKIIVGVREPIAQHISLLFSHLPIALLPVKKDAEYMDGEQLFYDLFIRHCNSDQYLEYATINKYSKKQGFSKGYETFLTEEFFDGHIKEGMGIDFYAWEFDKEKGYSIYERTLENGLKQKILLYKVEKLNELEYAFQDFLENKDFHLETSFTGDTQFYQTRYREFKKTIRLPKSYIDAMYHSRFVNHCYTKEEIEKFRDFWSNNGFSK